GEFADLGAVVVLAVGKIGGGQSRARARYVLVAHEIKQLDVGRLYHLANGLDRLRPQARLLVGRNTGHVLGRRVEETRLGGRLGDRGDRLVTTLHGDARRGEPTLHAGAHLVHLLVEVARDVVHLRNPVLVVCEAAKRTARGVAEIGPEGGVGVGRHL